MSSSDKASGRYPAGARLVYAFTTPYEEARGRYKIGETTRDSDVRILECIAQGSSECEYKKVFECLAVREDGTLFGDEDMHTRLLALGCKRYTKVINGERTEWFQTTPEQIREVYQMVYLGKHVVPERNRCYSLRPDQEDTVQKTCAYFNSAKRHGSAPKEMLWALKPRAGKTFTAYQTMKAMGWDRVLVLTFKPAVHDGWQDELLLHSDFDGCQFRDGETGFDDLDDIDGPVVCFLSHQDILNGSARKIKSHHAPVFDTEWDCIIIDENHWGAEGDRAEELIRGLGRRKKHQLRANHLIRLSGTAYRLERSGHFDENQICRRTYTAEQKEKHEWKGLHPGKPNPFASMPKMELCGISIPSSICDLSLHGGQATFSLSSFFATEMDEITQKPVFIYEAEVLNLMRYLSGQRTAHTGQIFAQYRAEGKSVKGATGEALPFSAMTMPGHMLWFMPGVDACKAMERMLVGHGLFPDHQVLVVAGASAGIGADALPPVQDAIGDCPEATKTISLSCGKLTQGVTIPAWEAVFMMSDLESAESYFQTLFRVQSPHTRPTGSFENGSEVMETVKHTCLGIDLSPNRMLRMLPEFACVETDQSLSRKTSLDECLEFMPCTYSDGFSLFPVDTEMVLAGLQRDTESIAPEKQWESNSLLSLDLRSIKCLKRSPTLLTALEKVSGASGLGEACSSVINSEESLYKNNQGQNSGTGDASADPDRDKLIKGLKSVLVKIPTFIYATRTPGETVSELLSNADKRDFRENTMISLSNFKKLLNTGILDQRALDQSVFIWQRILRAHDDAVS